MEWKSTSMCLRDRSCVVGDDGAVADGVLVNGLAGCEVRRMLGIGSVSGIRDMGLGSGRTPRT